MSYPDFVQDLLDAAPDAIRENARTVEIYNSNCEAARIAKNSESARMLEEINGETTHVENLRREQARHGLPFRTGTDKDGAPTRIEYDPTAPMMARIGAMKRERNRLEEKALPGSISFVPWLKTLRGQRLIAADPVKLPIRKSDNLADAFERACVTTDGEIAGYARVQRARVPKSEALERAWAYVERMAAPANASVYGLLQGGEFLRSGKFTPTVTRPEPDFAKIWIPQDGIADPIGIVDPVKFFASIAPDLLLGTLQRMIEAGGDDPNAIPSAEKPQRLADAAQAIVAAQRVEAAIGLECVRQRVPVTLRKSHAAVWLGADWPAAQIVAFLDQ